jgi:hypothetical protein
LCKITRSDNSLWYWNWKQEKVDRYHQISTAIPAGIVYSMLGLHAFTFTQDTSLPPCN